MPGLISIFPNVIKLWPKVTRASERASELTVAARRRSRRRSSVSLSRTRGKTRQIAAAPLSPGEFPKNFPTRESESRDGKLRTARRSSAAGPACPSPSPAGYA